MALGKRLINTGGVAVCNTETTDIFGDSNGVALYSLDYDASEASGSYNGTPTDVDFGVGGAIGAYGARFNGSSSKIEINSPIVNVSNDYTVSMWVNASDVTTFTAIFENINTDGYLANQALITILNGTIRLYVAPTSGSSRIYSYNFSGASLSVNTWYHLVFVVKTNSNHIAYIDGTPYSSTYLSSTTSTPSGFTTIGYGNADYFNGSIDQVRVFSKALNSTEISQLYAETACVHTATTTDNNYPTTNLAYYKLDNSAEDSVSTNNGTETNIEYRFGRYGQAAVFNGSSSKIIVPDSSDNLNFSNHIGTISAWVNLDSISGGEEPVVNKRDTGNPGNRSYLFNVTNGVVNWYTYNTDSNAQQVSSTSSLSASQWHHIVVILDQTNIKIYIDGALDKTASSTYTSIQDDGADFTIGYRGNNSGHIYFDGKIDQVRIFSTALSSSQVTELFNEKPETDTSNFKTVLYEGTGASQYISNVGFQPDFVWIKNRDRGTEFHTLADSVRGGGKRLFSNDTSAELTDTFDTQSFEANGFTIGNGGYVSRNNESHVAYCWKGGSDSVNIGVNSITGSTPSIASDVSANTEAGFSIVKYTGNSSYGQTVGHGLDDAPELVIIKNLDNARNWRTYAEPLGATKFINLDENGQAGTYGSFNNTAPTSSVFSTTNSSASDRATNFSGDDYIAYCWHSVAGYSKIGTYEGNGFNDYSKQITGLGFDPSFVMVKNVDSGGSNWEIIDSRRGDEKNLYANESYSENANSQYSYGSGKFITDGFKVTRGSVASSVHWNKSGNTYLYMAFK